MRIWHPMTALVQGFGCRPVTALRVRSEGRRPKALQEGTRGPPWGAGCRLWRFDRRAGWAGGALAGVVGVGSTVPVTEWSSRWQSTGRRYCDRGCNKRLRRGRGDSDAMPEAGFSGGWEVARGSEGQSWHRGTDPALGDGGARGSPPHPKLSTMIMRPPQQGHGGRWLAAAPAAASGSPCSLDGSADGRGAAISSLARAILALQVALASNP